MAREQDEGEQEQGEQEREYRVPVRITLCGHVAVKATTALKAELAFEESYEGLDGAITYGPDWELSDWDTRGDAWADE